MYITTILVILVIMVIMVPMIGDSPFPDYAQHYAILLCPKHLPIMIVIKPIMLTYFKDNDMRKTNAYYSAS